MIMAIFEQISQFTLKFSIYLKLGILAKLRRCVFEFSQNTLTKRTHKTKKTLENYTVQNKGGGGKGCLNNVKKSFTTAPILLLSNYFRQNYLEIASCSVSLFNNIWVQVEHSLLQKLNDKS